MTAHPGPARAAAPQASAGNPHRPLHSQTGALPGEHPGDQEIPLVKVAGLDGELGRFGRRLAGPASSTIRAGAISGRRRQ